MLIPLEAGETVIGRSPSSDVVLPSNTASRQHARIVVNGDGVSIEDLNSRNGVFVNEVRITRVQRLAVRDRIRIGDAMMKLVLFDEQKRTQGGEVLSPIAGPGSDESTSEPPPRALAVVGPIVEKLLALGKKEEADRLLRLPLQRLLLDSARGQTVSTEVTNRAAELAVKVAAATGRPQYIDLILRVHATHARPLPIAVIDELYGVLRAVRDVDRHVLEEYVDGLAAGAADLGPTERFALSRLVGLKQFAGASR
ncbi:MAG: FHA domain-containing protein [Polyangiaceae bacterium]|nr:FHA domain-containing protein [Polyangiaceae bacterium]